MNQPNCPLCHPQNEEVLLQTERLRVIAVDNEPNAPALCRVIWQEHIAEMTDLPSEQRNEIMDMVYRVEAAMRQVLKPTKINLASFGNFVPHLHWHVVARFQNDANFPAAIWAAAERDAEVVLPDNWKEQVKTQLVGAAA
ncbi:HIT family protein [Neisseria montereyensis]|uniref:HIT family protein n=1 Tax=Neisseria montereyensis TaxID=2973938 RepID=A0ABT2FCI3_9NEIS|nr:HIT family protein [Neisseria montereyensis]MCS4533867.1 HIT family protein [Neisseria montereyensis]